MNTHNDWEWRCPFCGAILGKVAGAIRAHMIVMHGADPLTFPETLTEALPRSIVGEGTFTCPCGTRGLATAEVETKHYVNVHHAQGGNDGKE